MARSSRRRRRAGGGGARPAAPRRASGATPAAARVQTAAPAPAPPPAPASPASPKSHAPAASGLLLIANQWVRGRDRAAVTDPFTGQVAAEVEHAGPRELDQALAAARAAEPVLAGWTRHRRAALLAEAARLLQRDHEHLAGLVTREAGKPIRLARLEVDRAVRTFTVAAAEAIQPLGELHAVDSEPGGEDYVARSERFPLGTVAAIAPFNFPLNLVAHKVAPALAVGNPVVIKPPTQAPSAALHLGRLLVEAGAPPGAVNVVPCRPDVAQALATDPRVRMLSFTGSAEVGWRLRALAAEKRCVMELGGNAAAVVHSDADLEWAARRLALGAYLYAGQVCIAVQRVVAERSVLRRFARLLAHAAEDLPAGDPWDPATVVGPMIDSGARERVEEWVREALGRGATPLVAGGRRGAVLLPVLLEDAPEDARVCAEEVFGPVAVLSGYDTFEQALEQVNRSRYGLQAGVFTQDAGRIERAFRTLDVGGVVVNDYPTLRFDHLPYGGVKASGQGREGVRSGMLEMTEPRLLLQRVPGLSEARAGRPAAAPEPKPAAPAAPPPHATRPKPAGPPAPGPPRSSGGRAGRGRRAPRGRPHR
ncbi:MAG TPA: aldehyde dehydrogenase family protein [Candidatus Saccharimonadales bacterium]|nr:aldehyde dehydrogenase family protein [Candidatus Saccharimonadales bacterium]